MSLNVAGKTAIVTGAGSGINLAFASLLLSKQCNVIFADLALRPEAKELVDKYSGSSPTSAKAIFQKTDVRNWFELEEMFRAANHHFGGADIVCPGAGVFEPPWSNFWLPPGTSPSKDSIEESRYAVLDINLTHPIRTTQLAISHFLNPADPGKRPPVSPSNPRSIIHVSSVAGQLCPLPVPIYGATKHALNGFVRSLAALEKELGIRVTAVAPGVIKTPLWTDSPEKMRMAGEFENWVTPEEVAERMVDLVERDDFEVVDPASGGMKMVHVGGGFILEVNRKVREVKAINDPGPSRDGNVVTGVEDVVKETLDILKRGGWGVAGEK